MPLVIKGNKQLTVDEHKVKEFLQLGYSEIDEKGNIIQKATPTTLNEIKAAYNTVCVENDSLRKEIETFKVEITTLKAGNETLNTKYEKLEKANEKLKAENEKLKEANK